MVGDSFLRPPLLFGSIFRRRYLLFEFRVAKVFKVIGGCVSFELSFFSFLIDVYTIAIHVVCFTFCVLDVGGLVTFGWCLAASLFGGLRCCSG